MQARRVGRIIGTTFGFIVVMLWLFSLGYTISALAGLPSGLPVPLWARGFGVVLIVVGMGLMGWMFRYRGFSNIVTSTWITFQKMARRAPLGDASMRKEPLVISGPHRYVRHPLYFGVVVMVLGWAVATGLAFLFITSFILLLWFTFVIARFEEKELRSLFGEDYTRYSDQVPMMIPFTKIRKKRG